MKLETPTQAQTNQMELLNQMKEIMRQDVIDEVNNKGIQEQLFSEYHDLAATTSGLLQLLRKYAFPEKLEAQDRNMYDTIMSQLSACGLRCQILVEESNNRHYENFLHTQPAQSEMVN